MACHVTVESVAYCSEDENCDGCEPLPFEWLPAYNAFAIVDRHCDESRDHQDPNNGDLVRGSHGARKENCRAVDSFTPANLPFALPVYVARRFPSIACQRAAIT